MYKAFAIIALFVSTFNLFLISYEKLGLKETAENFVRSKRDAGGKVTCAGDEVDSILSEGDYDAEKIRKLQCSVQSLYKKVEETGEDLTNALFYTNDLATKLQKTQQLVDENSNLLENQLEYLQDIERNPVVPQDGDSSAVVAAPQVAAPAEVAQLSNSVSNLNRTLNVWVSKSVLAYESQGRLSALAGAERRSMMERIINVEAAIAPGGPISSAVERRFGQVEVNMEGLASWVNAVNETMYERTEVVQAEAKVQEETTTAATTTTVLPTTTTVAATKSLPAVQSASAGEAMKKIKEIEESIRKNYLLVNGARSNIEAIEKKFEKHASESWYNAPNGYQYYLSVNAFKTDSFARSRRYCQYQGGDLAHVGMRDEAIYRFLWNTLLSRKRILCLWIGLTDMQQEGTWKWIDGKPSEDAWTNWSRGFKKASRVSELEDCAAIRSGIWNPTACSGAVKQKVCSFVCERRIFA